MAELRQHGRRRWLWIGVTVAVVVVAGGATWWFTRGTPSAASTPQSVSRTVAASVQTLRRTISTTGTVTPADQRDVAFAAGGDVTAVKVAVGDTVRKGQVLGTIGTVGLKADVASAKSTLAQANARVSADQDAVTAAADTDATTDDTTAAAQLAADKASVATAKASVADAEAALTSATLTSPIAGLVAEVNVAVGDSVSGSSSSASSSGAAGNGQGTGSGSGSGGGSGSTASSGSSSSQFLIVGTNSWTIDVSVDDSQINEVKKGLQAQITVDGITDPVFGRVTSVGLISTSTSDTASYPVAVAITGAPKGLHDGSAATVEIVYQQLTDVLAVPSAAVRQENGASVVSRSVNGVIQSVPVEVGDTVSGMTVITSGLTEGDEVVVTVATGTARQGTGTQNGTQNGELPGGGYFPGGGQGFPGGRSGYGGQGRTGGGQGRTGTGGG